MVWGEGFGVGVGRGRQLGRRERRLGRAGERECGWKGGEYGPGKWREVEDGGGNKGGKRKRGLSETAKEVERREEAKGRGRG